MPTYAYLSVKLFQAELSAHVSTYLIHLQNPTTQIPQHNTSLTFHFFPGRTGAVQSFDHNLYPGGGGVEV